MGEAKPIRKYDLLVVGSGSNAITTATVASRRGLKTALVYPEGVERANSMDHFKAVRSFIEISREKNLSKENPKLSEEDFIHALLTSNNARIEWTKNFSSDIIRDQGIDIYSEEGEITFQKDRLLEYSEGCIWSEYITFCDLPEVSTDTNNLPLPISALWSLNKLPRSIAIVGNQAVSIELAQAISSYGVNVTLIDEGAMLKEVGNDIKNILLRFLLEDDVMYLLKDQRIEIQKEEAGWTIKKQGRELVFCDYLFSVKLPDKDPKGMGIQHLNIEIEKDGLIVNKYLQTNQKGIYASSPAAQLSNSIDSDRKQSAVIIKNILEGNTVQYIPELNPWVLQTSPVIARVGITEEDAIAKYGEGNIMAFRMDDDIEKLIENRSFGGYLKVVFNKQDQVLGAAAAGFYAAEWIQLLSLVIKAGVPAEHVADTIFDYPTYNEIVRKVFLKYLNDRE